MKLEKMDFFEPFFNLSLFSPSNEDVLRELDWDKARDICLEHPNSVVCAGLAEDWDCTSGVIFDRGKFMEGDLHTSFFQSRWATPVLQIDDSDDGIECWKTVNEFSREGWQTPPKWYEKAE